MISPKNSHELIFKNLKFSRKIYLRLEIFFIHLMILLSVNKYLKNSWIDSRNPRNVRNLQNCQNLSKNLEIHLLVSIKFNIIETKAFLRRSAPNKHTHKWPIKAAKQNEVIYLRITNYNSNDLVIFLSIFQKY